MSENLWRNNPCIKLSKMLKRACVKVLIHLKLKSQNYALVVLIPVFLDHIRVDYYGTEMPLNQVANINATDARTLTITPWEKNMVPVIEKAIMNSDLGLNPATAGESFVFRCRH